MRGLSLSEHWQFKQRTAQSDLKADFASSDDWLPAIVPGTVHQDLLRAGKIPDPFFGMNEQTVQWVGEVDWLYRCTFTLDEESRNAANVDLCFDGLDTFAKVYVNDELVLTSTNMFVPARVAIKHLLNAGENRLCILFESALMKGKAIEAEHGVRPAWNGDQSRVYVRKAQYHYGWDWGPTLLTAGLWQPARIESYTSRIAEMHIPAEIATDLTSATLPVNLTVSPSANEALSVHLTLLTPENTELATADVPVTSDAAQYTFTVTNPALWYPLGYGAQPRYRARAELRAGDKQLDSHEINIGLRRLRLVQEPVEGESGTSFTFEINNVSVFCGGANWIPANSFTPRVTPEQYRAWLKLAADANIMMLRVWGGGIYENAAFYEICDELGLLVWQDFMFACGMYPAHPEFLANVRAEAQAQVRRLRHYASLALWCGNNEDYQIAEAIHVYDPAFNGDFVGSAFPAREIYERLLPEVCANLDPTRPYWQGSPYGGQSVYDGTLGDRHTWEIWHGQMADYHDYVNYSGRFVSEFGMQGAPVMPTITGFTEPADRKPDSAVMNFHNKATGGPERLHSYLERGIGLTDDIEDYVYMTQFVQSEALAAAYNDWRRRWGKPGRRITSGALVWQLNDCYPVTSWAIADYYLRPKMAYYRVRRSLAPIVAGFAAQDGKLAAWVVNGTTRPLRLDIETQVWSLDGAQLSNQRYPLASAANQVTELGLIEADPARNVVTIRLWEGDVLIARAARFPEPPNSITYADPGLQVERLTESTLRLTVKRPVRGVLVSANSADSTWIEWNNNTLDLVPDDPQIIMASAPIKGPVMVRWYGGKPTKFG